MNLGAAPMFAGVALVLTLAACGDSDSGSTSPAPARGPRASGAEDEIVSGTSRGGRPADADGRWFVEVSAAAGLDFVHDAGLTAAKHLPETMGAGAALADLDGDGDLDAYLVQGGPLPGQPAAGPRPTNRLFRNDGTGRFDDATAASGAAAHDGYGMGTAVGDVEGDGDLDLLVTNFGRDVLLRNDGRGRFADVTDAAGLDETRWTGSAVFFDAEGDGDLDLFVAAYVQVDLAHPLWCGGQQPGWRSVCHPDAYEGLPDRLWRNRGDGRFEDVTEQAGLATQPGRHGKGLGVIAVDVDGDIDLDLYVANDSVENRLWINLGDGRFEDGTLLSGTGVNGRGLTEAGMGLAAGDVDADGDADLFVTNFDDESNTLYRNDGAGLFTDVTAGAGLDGPSRLPVGFGTVMADLDGDGDLDLAVTNGHIVDNIGLYHDGKTHAQRALLFTNDGRGLFRDASDAAGDLGTSAWVGRGLYDGDVDGDGDLDLLLTRCGERALLFRNQGGPGGRAAGGQVVIGGLPPGTPVQAHLSDGRLLARTAGPQPSYFGQTSGDVHLGLGTAVLAALVVADTAGRRHELTFTPPLAGGRVHLSLAATGLELLGRVDQGTMLPHHPAPDPDR